VILSDKKLAEISNDGGYATPDEAAQMADEIILLRHQTEWRHRVILELKERINKAEGIDHVSKNV
jgi:hypothetical protein